MKWQIGEDYKNLSAEITELDEEIKERWSRLVSSKRHLGENRNKNIGDTLGDNVAIVVDMEAEINKKIEALKALRLTIEEIIDDLPSEQRRLMRMRYLRDFNWQQVANRLYCDESTCRRLHRGVIRKLEDRC